MIIGGRKDYSQTCPIPHVSSGGASRRHIVYDYIRKVFLLKKKKTRNLFEIKTAPLTILNNDDII